MRGGTAALRAMEGHLARRYTHVAPEGGFELEPYPAIRAWLERVAAQPGHVKITD